jgi:BirA family biotin operon repressor/biotin-[acetyl-CoA-carboxylase] ligase
MPEGATSLAQLAGPSTARPGRATLLDSYLKHLDARSQALDDSGRRVELLDDYRRACSTLGRNVSVDLGAERLVGTATGIASSGNLVVTTGSRAREVAAGDVVHLQSP